MRHIVTVASQVTPKIFRPGQSGSLYWGRARAEDSQLQRTDSRKDNQLVIDVIVALRNWSAAPQAETLFEQLATWTWLDLFALFGFCTMSLPRSRRLMPHLVIWMESMRRLWISLDKVNTLLDVLLEVCNHVSVMHTSWRKKWLTSQASLQQTFLIGSQFANGVDLLDAIGTELNFGGEEVNTLILIERAVDEGRLNHGTLALSSLEQALSEASTGHSHGQSGGSSTILGLDDLVTTKLNAVDQIVELLA